LPARRALDQRNAEKIFEFAQTLRDGCLGDMQRIGGPLKAAPISNSDKCLHTEGIDFHKKN